MWNLKGIEKEYKMEWVTRERVNGKWINTYAKSAVAAKKLMRDIMSRGGVAIALRCAY